MPINQDSGSSDPAVSKTCIRCGTCCEKGGPSLHGDDRRLVDDGLIHTRYLYTIREGEMVHDNVRNMIMPSSGEIIKIKGIEGSWQCTFFNVAEKACRIYQHRPMECRILKCWDPSALAAVYDRDRLMRSDLLSGIAGLWDLVREHERRCGYATLKLVLKDLEKNRDTNFQRTAISSAVTMVRYDQEIRGLVTAKGAVEPDMTDFLFGRPLADTIESFGYGVRQREGKLSLVRL